MYEPSTIQKSLIGKGRPVEISEHVSYLATPFAIFQFRLPPLSATNIGTHPRIEKDLLFPRDQSALQHFLTS